MRRDASIGVALGLVSALGFGVGPIFALTLYRMGMEPLPVLAVRFTLGAILMWVVVLAVPEFRRGVSEIETRNVAVLVVLGLLLMFATISYYWSITLIPVTVAVMIINLSPGLVALLALRYGLPLDSRRSWAALILGMAGATLTVAGPASRLSTTGLVLALITTGLMAMYSMLSARTAGERPGEIVPGVESGPAVAVMISCTAACLLVAAGVSGQLTPLRVPDAAFPLLFLFALTGTVVAIQASYAAQARIGASRNQVILRAEPIVTILLATIVLGEALSAPQVLGTICVVIALLLMAIEVATKSHAPAVR